MQIIDFHTHTFEDNVAERAIKKLSASANIISYLGGTDGELIQSNRNGYCTSVVLPVATKISQSDGINSRNYKKNMISMDTGVIYFAAIHPDDSDIKAKLFAIKSAGFKGIKLHPAFQGLRIDDNNYLKIIDIASGLGLITVIHAGYDISYPQNENASVRYILNMVRTLNPERVVLAHMGGWNQWDMVESDLAGANVYFDTSFCLNELIPNDRNLPFSNVRLSKEQFLRIVKLHGIDRILFGTDSPWSDREESVNIIKSIGLSQSDLDRLLYKNASAIL